jgi:hypothetical protein
MYYNVYCCLEQLLSRHQHPLTVLKSICLVHYCFTVVPMLCPPLPSFTELTCSLCCAALSWTHGTVLHIIINSTYSNLIFKIQKRIVRIIMKARNKDSCHPLFRQLNILPLYSQYIFSAIHGINTRQGSHLHFPTNKLAKVQKGVYYSGIRIYNNLPLSIRNLQNDIIRFKQALKRFLLTGSFYSLNEYYEWNTRGDLDSYK